LKRFFVAVLLPISPRLGRLKSASVSIDLSLRPTAAKDFDLGHLVSAADLGEGAHSVSGALIAAKGFEINNCGALIEGAGEGPRGVVTGEVLADSTCGVEGGEDAGVAARLLLLDWDGGRGGSLAASLCFMSKPVTCICVNKGI